jgi:N-acetylglucosamine-6-phosphate deacetylase
MRAFVNADVLTPAGRERGRAVLVAGGRIEQVLADDDARLRDADVVDLGGRLLAPGFIDCQVNGGGGVFFNDAPDVDTIRRICAAHARFGTTGFLPTLISDDLDVMRAAIAAVAQAIEENVPGVLGIHLEGPFLAPERRGIHDAARFIVPGAADLALACSLIHGRTLLTLAPERVAPESVAQLVRAGVVGAALDDARSWCGVIVDGFHLHPAVLRIALAAKPRGKLFLVTDAMPPVGSACDRFELNGQTITCRDGRCVNADGTLAGSALDMAAAVRNTIAQAAVDTAEALRLASAYPAEFLGLAAAHGYIVVGARADFVVLDDALNVGETWIGGERVFPHPAG